MCISMRDNFHQVISSFRAVFRLEQLDTHLIIIHVTLVKKSHSIMVESILVIKYFQPVNNKIIQNN